MSVTKAILNLDKVLLKIDNLNDLEKYEKLGVTNFLFPLQNFSIGYNTFKMEELGSIKGNIYVLANRLLTDDDLLEFEKMTIPSYIKGFIIEDIGLYEILKNKEFELILFQNHLNNNSETINYWLNFFDSLVISTDITSKEIIDIANRSLKPLVLNTFGYPMIMYSRRTLVSNFYKHFDKEIKRDIEITENNSKSHFFMNENNLGTATFNGLPYDYRGLIPDLKSDNIKFYLIDTFKFDYDIIKKIIMGERPDIEISSFLDKKTVYRIGDLK